MLRTTKPEGTARFLLVWHKDHFQVIDTDNHCAVIHDNISTRGVGYQLLKEEQDKLAT